GRALHGGQSAPTVGRASGPERLLFKAPGRLALKEAHCQVRGALAQFVAGHRRSADDTAPEQTLEGAKNGCAAARAQAFERPLLPDRDASDVNLQRSEKNSEPGRKGRSELLQIRKWEFVQPDKFDPVRQR